MEEYASTGAVFHKIPPAKRGACADLGEGERFGFSVKDVRADYGKAYERSRQVSARLVKGIEYLMKKNKITVYKDTASFAGKKELLLEKSKERLTAKISSLRRAANRLRCQSSTYGKPNVLDSKKGAAA